MIGSNIYRIRKQKRLTLSELAERANISKSYLSNIERNLNQNPSIQIIGRIASVLDVNLDKILGIEQEKTVYPETEWIEFVNELKDSGIKKEQLHEYKPVIEFVRWKNKKQQEK
ncbi:helix-turn-helix domain-containing protein [Aquibacillus halophilus]|uniref:Helix-turn-helix domain-containing protein n=1 Tax=Aquibacillus halophilus TaxID=930132 RepID=A0A6A8DAF8_9BACI|nr:helix-turn-helix transcriptional regulator [Aquibacillus halophilus]MRH42695.1 helix-turn-helix domain-containing protein [Aquibacillus halophilus]